MGRHSRSDATVPPRIDVSREETVQFALPAFPVETFSERPSSVLANSDTRQMAIDSISRMIDLIDMIDSAPDPRAARRAAQRASFIDFRQIASASTRLAHAAKARVRHSAGGRHRGAVDGDRDTRSIAPNSNHRWADDAIVNTMTNEDLSVLKRAQELVRKHDEELRAQRVEREGRVRQTGSLIATYSADCSLRLAELPGLLREGRPRRQDQVAAVRVGREADLLQPRGQRPDGRHAPYADAGHQHRGLHGGRAAPARH